MAHIGVYHIGVYTYIHSAEVEVAGFRISGSGLSSRCSFQCVRQAARFLLTYSKSKKGSL